MKTVLITGASSGIGRMTAELMRSRGWNVAATSRDPVGLPEGLFGIALDVTNDASIAAAVARVVEKFGTIDVLVNNAGYGVFGPLEGTTAQEIEQQFQTNVIGVVNVTRHVMAVMRAQKRGTIINVSSIGGRTAAPFASLYHASKFAIEGFSESLRYEASLHGIHVKVVEPSHFKTGFITRSLKRIAHPAYDAAFENYMKWVLIEDAKAPSPEPVGAAILQAAEDTSSRLRYPVKGALILALTKLLPDAMWRGLMAEGMTRKPKEK